jgi:hypothetical protein
VIVELPLVTAAEIAAEYRPGGEATVKATLRRLRDRELISAGVAEHPRGAAGRVAGVWHVYSALNLDAVRAARAHDESAAKAIAKRAARIESRRATVEFVRRLAELGGSASLRWRFEWASSLDEELRKALVAVVAETVAERDRLVHDPAAVPRLGLVAAIHGELAELMLEGAEAPVSIPIPDLELLDSAFVGAALALRRSRSAAPGPVSVVATVRRSESSPPLRGISLTPLSSASDSSARAAPAEGSPQACTDRVP